ncbi:hypothetical protein PVAP13_7NG128800 [Panicum virgatum]|uniref:Uncharacterized protein n=1 Tax=Panicum virgatum TaxID=38727 RepID=A0A8T0PVF5_PANVG|nr:hypothetical protein PVAP13_7NG128800 [Panicum virgatum]
MLPPLHPVEERYHPTPTSSPGAHTSLDLLETHLDRLTRAHCVLEPLDLSASGQSPMSRQLLWRWSFRLSPTARCSPKSRQCREMLGSLLDDQHQAVQSTHGSCVLF